LHVKRRGEAVVDCSGFVEYNDVRRGAMEIMQSQNFQLTAGLVDFVPKALDRICSWGFATTIFGVVVGSVSALVAQRFLGG
jgi:hypothetical protein